MNTRIGRRRREITLIRHFSRRRDEADSLSPSRKRLIKAHYYARKRAFHIDAARGQPAGDTTHEMPAHDENDIKCSMGSCHARYLLTRRTFTRILAVEPTVLRSMADGASRFDASSDADIFNSELL